MQVIQSTRPAPTVYPGFKAASRNLWRGVNSVLLGAGPAHALHFATYEYVKEKLGADEEQGNHTLSFAAAGACATLAHDTLMTPFDGKCVALSDIIHGEKKLTETNFYLPSRKATDAAPRLDIHLCS